MVVKYTLLHKPTLSSWPTIPRQVKTIILVVILSTTLFMAFVQSARNAQLRNLYWMKATTADVLDLEITFMPDPQPDTNDHWKSASIPDGSIYSAYLDSRPGVVLEDRHHDHGGQRTWAMIRVIAILPIEMNNNQLTCYFKYKSDSEDGTEVKRTTASRVRAIKENWDLQYSAFFVLCDLTLPVSMRYEDYYNDHHLPMKVALGSTNHEDPANLEFIDIHYPRDGIAQKKTNGDEFLAVCGPVFHHEYDRALHLVEYIEYHLMLGVNHFTFYNESVSPEVDKVLSHYADKGIATILNWKLPSIYKFELTLRLDGFFAALNDCLYRSSLYRNYDYVLVSNIDEFVVPRKHKDFKELISFLDPPRPSGFRNSHASLKFKNAFFYLMYDDDKTNRESSLPYLYLQAKTQRVESPDDPEDGGKYIARSHDVVELGSNKVWSYVPGSSAFFDTFDELVVDEEVALSHHYRTCEAETAACYFKPTIIDRTAHNFTKKLGNRVANSCTRIFLDSKCPAPTD